MWIWIVRTIAVIGMSAVALSVVLKIFFVPMFIGIDKDMLRWVIGRKVSGDKGGPSEGGAVFRHPWEGQGNSCSSARNFETFGIFHFCFKK